MYEEYLFLLNEVLDDKTTMDLGRMWQKHHDRDPKKRFEQRVNDNINKFYNNPLLIKAKNKRDEVRDRYDKASDEYSKKKWAKADSHLDEYQDNLDNYMGKKAGYELRPGNIRLKHITQRFAPITLKRAGINTMHQRAGERSMAAIQRLTNYLNRNGVNQENPTSQDKANFAKFKQRMSGHPLWK